MRLFDFQRAPNPRRVRMFIAEKGLEIPRIQVNLYRMEQLSPEFLAINPAGTVPVLQTEEGEFLSESLAICHYLEQRYPEPRLLGADALEQARILMWTVYMEQHGIPAIADVLRNWSPGFRNRAYPGTIDYAQLPALIDRGRRRSAQFFDRIEQQLQQRAWLASSGYSFADISLLALTDFARWVEIDATDGRAALADWYGRASRRPSARA